MSTTGGNDELQIDDDGGGEAELATQQLLARIAEFDVGTGASPTVKGGLPAAATTTTATTTSATGDAGATDASAQPQSLFALDEPAALLLDVDSDFDLDLDVDATGIDLRSIEGVIGGADRPPSIGANKSSESTHQSNDSTESSPGTPPIAGNMTTTDAQLYYRGRKNAKKELAYLREQVQALEQQLSDLQHPKRSSSGSSVSRSTADKSAAAVWEQIAQRQQIEKQKAEVENVKLREVLEGQLRVANSLEKILRKRPNASVHSAVSCALPVLNHSTHLLPCLFILMQLSGSRPLKRTQELRSDFDWRARTSLTLSPFSKRGSQTSIRNSTACWWRVDLPTRPTRFVACK